jgi:hypothetical protein
MNGVVKKIVPDKPPELQAPAVVKHQQITKATLAVLEAQIPETAFAAAVGKPGGAENLSSLREKIAAAKFMVENYPKARAYAELLDEQALVDWRAAVQTLDPAELVAGIGKEVCPRLCGAGGGCVISGSDAFSGPCCHPLREGLMLTRYKESAQIVRVFSAACAALRIRSNA